MEKIAIDLRYAENINSGLTRFSKNLFLNLIKEKSLNKQRFLIILPPKKFSSHLTEFTDLKKNRRLIVLILIGSIPLIFCGYILHSTKLIYHLRFINFMK